MKNRYFLFILIAVVLSSCKKESNTVGSTGRVIVVNEGGFNHGDASVSVYDPSAKSIVNNIFKSQNGFALGDVAQSLYLIGDTAFIVMNNSQGIIVADAAHDFRYLYKITMTGASPRFFMPVGNSRAYVTELYANKIWIVNYSTGAVTGSIPVSGWTEQMVSTGGKIYVLEKTAPSGPSISKLLEIDPSSDRIVNSIDFASDPGSMALTDQGQLFVLTTQQATPAVSASLYMLDIASFTITKKMDFNQAHTPGYLRYSSFAHQLIYVDHDIYTMSQTDTVLPQTASISSNNWNVYGLNADPATGDIYISDALDYQQASHIMRYSQRFTSIDAFYAGIITNGFIFR